MDLERADHPADVLLIALEHRLASRCTDALEHLGATVVLVDGATLRATLGEDPATGTPRSADAERCPWRPRLIVTTQQELAADRRPVDRIAELTGAVVIGLDTESLGHEELKLMLRSCLEAAQSR